MPGRGVHGKAGWRSGALVWAAGGMGMDGDEGCGVGSHLKGFLVWEPRGGGAGELRDVWGAKPEVGRRITEGRCAGGIAEVGGVRWPCSSELNAGSGGEWKC